LLEQRAIAAPGERDQGERGARTEPDDHEDDVQEQQELIAAHPNLLGDDFCDEQSTLIIVYLIISRRVSCA